SAPGFMDFADAREKRDAVPAALAMPDRLITRVTDRFLREALLRRLQLLKDNDVRLGKVQPAEQHWQAAVDAIHIVGGDFHRSGRTWSARPQWARFFEPARFTISSPSPICQWDGVSRSRSSSQVSGVAI